jgi:hypothetical protein
MKVTTHLPPMLRLRMHGALSPLPYPPSHSEVKSAWSFIYTALYTLIMLYLNTGAAVPVTFTVPYQYNITPLYMFFLFVYLFMVYLMMLSVALIIQH